MMYTLPHMRQNEMYSCTVWLGLVSGHGQGQGTDFRFLGSGLRVRAKPTVHVMETRNR